MNTPKTEQAISTELHGRVCRVLRSARCGGLAASQRVAAILVVLACAAQAQTPHSAKDYLDRGAARYSAGDLDGAIRDFDKAIEINSGHVKSRGKSAKPQNFTGDERPGRQEQIIIEDSFNAVAYYDRGTAWYSKDDLERAIADFDRAIRIAPRYTDAYIRRGRAWHARGDLDRAIADYDRAIRTDPCSAFAHNDRGIAREDKGDMAGAIADFDMAILLDKGLGEAYINRGVARCGIGDVTGAIADLDAAIAMDPRSAAAYNNRASARRASGDLAGAIADHDRAIALDPHNALAYVNRGLTLMRQGKSPEARADFQRGLLLNPALRNSIETLTKGEEMAPKRRTLEIVR